MRRILLAEDDMDFGQMLTQYLALNKFDITWAHNGEEAYNIFLENDFDLCVIDVMMPVMDGFTLAKKITDIKPETPFLFLTARKTQEDKVKGLKLGADDYIVKPFNAEELILRVKNIIRRTEQQASTITNTPTDVISIGTFDFDYPNLELKGLSNTQKLTQREANIINYLYTNRNQLIKRDTILLDLWNKTDFFSGRSMDVFISKIRKYFKTDPAISIESVRGIGLEFKLKD